jgi:threonine aldolase
MTVDLRSDTVTKPSAAMRRAMADAEVADDVYGEDPTAHRLHARVAEMFGKEAALFVPSGTMANQIALMLHCKPGDSVIVGEGTHCMVYETGASAAWAGVQFEVVGRGGLFSAVEMEAAIAPAQDYASQTTLVVVENTHNRSGGRVFPQPAVVAIAERARARGLGVHLDGARLWNASIASGKSLAELAAPFDTISACFSKGLGAPVGSALIGSRDQIKRAIRLRKMLGGGMRQVGVLCAAALHALDHHIASLADDHALARKLAQGVNQIDGLSVALDEVETNIINIDVRSRPAPELVTRLKNEGVLVNATSPQRIRAVTHRDLGSEDISRAIDAFGRVS